LYNGCDYLLLLISGASECGYGAADIALNGGRTAGIINQIIEGGFAYSVCLLSIIFLLNNNEKFKNYFIYYLNLIIYGIILVGSKLSYLIGMPIFILLIFVSNKCKVFIRYKVLIVSLVFFALFNFIKLNWDGLIPIDRGHVYIQRLINPIIDAFHTSEKHNLVSIYTSGRLGENTKKINQENSDDKPSFNVQKLIGSGYGLHPPVDSMYRELLLEGGYISLIAFFFLLSTLTYFALSTSTILGLLILISMIALLTIGSLGSSLLTGNRVNFLFFVTFFSIYFTGNNEIHKDRNYSVIRGYRKIRRFFKSRSN
jgi:hypothetical protein